MRTNRVVRKSIKRLRSKNRRNKVNRKTKKRTQKRTQKRVKRCKNYRKTKKIKKFYELNGGFGPHIFAAQRRRQREQQREEQREQEQERAIQQQKAIIKEEAGKLWPKYKEEEKKAEELFKEYRRIINSLNNDQLRGILKATLSIFNPGGRPYLTGEVRNIIQTSDRENLIEMVFNNTSRLRQVNKELWNEYFDHSKIIKNYYRDSPVMETSSPIRFYNPLTTQSKDTGDL